MTEKKLLSAPASSRSVPLTLLIERRSVYFGTVQYLQNVVARGVTKVPHANLRAHVPATEGAARELKAADLQQHVGDCWETVPLQVEIREPFIPVESQKGLNLKLFRLTHFSLCSFRSPISSNICSNFVLLNVYLSIDIHPFMDKYE